MIFQINMRNELNPLYVSSPSDRVLLEELNGATRNGSTFMIAPDDRDNMVMIHIANINTIRKVSDDDEPVFSG